jgi:AcrR family transcriptional regulator
MDVDDKRERILLTALRLFIEQGFQGTPTAQIAKECGVATGTLFHYFKTKDELIAAAFTECKKSFAEALTGGIKPGDPFKKQFRGLFENAIRWGIENRDMCLFYQQFGSSPYTGTYVRSIDMNDIPYMIDFIESAKKQKLLKDVPTDLMISMLAGIKISVINYFLENKDRIDDGASLDKAFDMLWSAIKR